jgi:hypothetical protein
MVHCSTGLGDFKSSSTQDHCFVWGRLKFIGFDTSLFLGKPRGLSESFHPKKIILFVGKLPKFHSF